MSPTVFRERGYRFYFFSLEESRMHVHVASPDGEAKFWLEPEVAPAVVRRLADFQVNEIRLIIEEHKKELTDAWREHLGS